MDNDVVLYLINISLCTPSLKIHYDKIKVRGALNIYIDAPISFGKSTIIREIEANNLCVVIRELTPASVLGTIKRDGTFLAGVVEKFNNNSVIIDEFQSVRKDVKEILLGLMEESKYEKALAYHVTYPYRSDCVTVDKNFIKVKVNSSFIVTSMLSNKTQLLSAIISRCLPLFVYDRRVDVFEKFLYPSSVSINRGEIERARKELKDVYVNRNERALVISSFVNSNIPQSYMLRAMNDFVRVCVVESFMRGYNEITRDIVEDLKFVVKIQEMGYQFSHMSRASLMLYSLICKAEKDEDGLVSVDYLCKKMNKTDRYIRALISELKQNSMITVVTKRKKKYVRPL